MTHLLLSAQKIANLKEDPQVTHLTITRKWLADYSFKEVNQLSQLYPNVKSINLSDVDLSRSDPDLIISISTAFPEITELVLAQACEAAVKVVPKIALGFKFLEDFSFSDPPKPQSTFSYLNPFSWNLPFWQMPPTSAASAICKEQHHHTLRDLFDVSNINTGASNILSDWNRIEGCLIEINNDSIFTLVHAHNGHYFPTLVSLKNFFLEHLLYKLPQEQQSKALDYAMQTLHQGGLQNPVTASVYQYCANKDTSPQPVDASNKVNGIPGQNRVIKFEATEKGFTVHELLTQNRLAYPINAGDNAGEFVLPDEGFSYVFKAEAKLNVQWAFDASDTPQINIENIGISFGSTITKSFFDERWFYQKWVDNARYYAGFNRVADNGAAQPTLK